MASAASLTHRLEALQTGPVVSRDDKYAKSIDELRYETLLAFGGRGYNNPVFLEF